MPVKYLHVTYPKGEECCLQSNFLCLLGLEKIVVFNIQMKNDFEGNFLAENCFTGRSAMLVNNIFLEF